MEEANAEQGSLAHLITLNARKHSLPNFFQNWSCENSTKDLHTREALSILAVCAEELHFSQAIQLINIFCDKYSTLLERESSASVKELVYILAQIFSTFLLHIKILEPSLPSHVHEKYSDLIKLTINKLKNDSHILLDENQVLLNRSHLLLCNTVGKVKLAIDKKSSTLLFDFLTKHAEALLNGEDEVLSLLAFQLLILKLEGLMHKKEMTEVEVLELKQAVSIIVQHAHENIDKGSLWDLDLNSLSKDNYGTAVWRRLLDFLPIILNTMDSKELIKICHCLREVILQGDFVLDSDNVETTDLRSIVLFTLQSSHFQESKAFQSSLISAVWKMDSLCLASKRFYKESEPDSDFTKVLTSLSIFRRNWITYEVSNPKNSENGHEQLNPVWHGIKIVCSYLNDVLSMKLDSRIKIKTQIYNILQLIQCLPLRYLLPVNQMRCVIGLSTLLFLVPESCQSTKAIKISEKIANQIITIFEGERSIWLFDFVESGPFLRKIMDTIEKLADREQLSDVPDSFKLLLKHLINLIMKNSKVLAEAKKYFSEETCLNNVICKFFARISQNNQDIPKLVSNDNHYCMWENMYLSLSQHCSTDITILGDCQYMQIYLQKDEVERLQHLFHVMSPEELNEVFNQLMNHLKNWDIAQGNIFEMNLNIIKEIVTYDSKRKEPVIFKQSVIDLLSCTSSYVHCAENTILHLNMIKIPIFCFFNCMVKLQKSCLSEDHLMDILHICMTVNLNLSDNLQVYIKAFNAVWNAIQDLLVYKPHFILKTTSIFMVIVTNLLRSLVLAGSEDAVNQSMKDVQNGMLQCSRNMARLFTMITRYKPQFEKLVPFLIGDYADSVQHNTLEVNIKGNLIAGLNRLLDLCSESSLKMVSLTINYKCREVFTKIVKDYNQSRYRGYI